MNEGHAAFLTLQLLRESTPADSTEWDFPAVRRRCVFTTHTPVPAGHDQFAYDLVRRVMGDLLPLEVLQMLGGQYRPEHDAPGLQHEYLYQRRGEAAWRSLTGDVSQSCH